MHNTQETMKLAAQSIRTLVDQIEEFEKTAEIHKEARSLAEQLLETGLLSKDEVFKKLAELERSTLEDLKIIKKALEMGTLNSQFKLAEVSDMTEPGAMDPRRKFIFDVLQM